MYICSYAGSEKPHFGGNISFGPFLAAATNLPKVIGNIYVTTYAISFLHNRIDQLPSRTYSCRRTVRCHFFHNVPCVVEFFIK